MVRAVLFDFNGVIIDDERVHLDLFVEVLSSYGVVVDRDLYWKEFLGMDDRGALSGLWFRHFGSLPEDHMLSELIEKKARIYMERLSLGLPLYNGVLSLVTDLSHIYPMGIVSGALRPEIEGTLAQNGLTECFQFIVSAEDTEKGKPDPEGYVKGFSRLALMDCLEGLTHDEVLVIEDSVQGIEAAKRAGLKAFAVCHTYSPESFSHADRVYPDVGKIQLQDVLSLP
ncbi:MAG: HAD family hydrolase [Leptospirillum sp.]|jgi:HAD superfamily hydrolase (TIGR01509 family)